MYAQTLENARFFTILKLRLRVVRQLLLFLFTFFVFVLTFIYHGI